MNWLGIAGLSFIGSLLLLLAALWLRDGPRGSGDGSAEDYPA